MRETLRNGSGGGGGIFLALAWHNWPRSWLFCEVRVLPALLLSSCISVITQLVFLISSPLPSICFPASLSFQRQLSKTKASVRDEDAEKWSFQNWVFKQGWAQQQVHKWGSYYTNKPQAFLFWRVERQNAVRRKQVVTICGWERSAWQEMEARASLFRGQCTHSYQPGGRLRTLRNVSRQGVRVWGEYCAIVTLDLTVWHWFFLPPVGPLCLIQLARTTDPLFIKSLT